MVDVTKGLFTALLASYTGDVINGLLFSPGPKSKKLYLEIQVAGDAPLVPRTELGTVPHPAFRLWLHSGWATG